MDLHDDARRMAGDLADCAEALHRDPEVGLELPRTQERVLAELDGLGLEITTGTDTTSVTAVLRGGRPRRRRARAVLLRGDMDALPVEEADRPRVRRDQRRDARLRARPAHRRRSSAAPGCSPSTATGSRATSCSCSSPARRGSTAPGVMLREGVLDAAGGAPTPPSACTCSPTDAAVGPVLQPARHRSCRRRTGSS